MRMQSHWSRYLSRLWFGFALCMLLVAKIVESSNHTSPDPDAGELHLGVKESITLGRVLLGTILARLIFFLMNRALHYVDRQHNRQLRPFHWQVINRLRLSQGWIRRMNQEDAELIKSFIDGVPIEGRLPTASPTSPRLLRIANLLETLQLPYRLRMRCLGLLAHLGIFQPREPAYHALETSTTVVDLETSFHSLTTLVQHRDWHNTPQAHQLAAMIANVLRERVCAATFRRFADIGGLPWRLSGSGFDLARLAPPQKYTLDHQIVRSLRAHQSRSTSLRVTFRTSTVEDRLRRYYETLHLMRGSDPFALPGQRVSSYWQPLELLRRNRIEPGALSLHSVSMTRELLESSTHARTEAGGDAVTTYDHQRSGALEERWLPIDLEGLMADGQTRLILKGEVGAGKTTWCRRLAKTWSAEESPSWLNGYRCLLLISLRDWSNHMAEVERESTGSRRERVQYWLAEGVWYYSLDTADPIGYRPPLREVLFVLDGYDEVAEAAASRDSLLGDVLHHLLQARGTYAAPNVIITTRPQVDLTHHRDFVDQARVCRIKGLSREHQADFVRQFFGEHYFLETSESSPLLLSQSFLDTLGQHSTLKQLQHNPLLLKMMCWLYFDRTHQQAHLPSLFDASSTRLTPFYEKTISALKRRRSILSSDVPICDRLLKRLAHQREVVITSSRVAEVFRSLEIHDQTEQQRLLSVLSVDLGLLQPLRPNTDPLNCHWEFLHKSFQEYYRALALIDELLSDAVSIDTVFNELRLSAQEDGQLGYFLVGLLSTHPDERLTPILQSFINRAIDSCTESLALEIWTWRLLGEVPSSQRSRFTLPSLDVLVKLGWLPNAIDATGSIELCDWLINRVPDADKQLWVQWANDDGLTALHSAAFRGHRFICQWLFEQVIEEDRLTWMKRVDFMKRTALHLAALNGHESVCRLLVEQVPEEQQLVWIQKASKEGLTALHLASEKGHEPVCRCLAEQVPAEHRLAWIQKANEDGQTALHVAAVCGHKSLCHWLVEQVPEEDRLAWIQKADGTGWTALHLATATGHEPLCHWLVEQVTEEDRVPWIKKATEEGWTALHMAAHNGHESACHWLVGQVPEEERLAWIQLPGHEGLTALHMAAREGHASVYRWLVDQVPEKDRSVWIQKTTKEDWIALQRAAYEGKKFLFFMLWEIMPEEGRLAWIQKVTNEGLTALHLAAYGGQESVCRLFVEQVPEEARLAWIQQATKCGATALHPAALNGHESACRWLVEQLPEEHQLAWIQQATKQGATALHLAALNGHNSVCRWLLKQVPDKDRLAWIQRTTKSGSTALHLAAEGGHESVYRWLAEQLPEADRLCFLQKADGVGKTALDHLSDEKAQRLLALVPASHRPTGTLVPTPPIRPPRVRQTRGRLVGDTAERAGRPVSDGDIVGLEETKGEHSMA